MSDIIPAKDAVLVFDDVDGHKVITALGSELRVCDPCWRWSEVARRAVWTGGPLDRFFEPNLCKAHRARYLRGSAWDEPLADSAGRPREHEGECGLEDCEDPAYSLGLCRRHYQKDYRAKARAKEESLT